MKRHSFVLSASFVLFSMIGTIQISNGFGAEDLMENKKPSAMEEAKDFPRIQFDELVCDLGKVTQNQTLEHIFTFKNIGKGVLLIQKVKAG